MRAQKCAALIGFFRSCSWSRHYVQFTRPACRPEHADARREVAASSFSNASRSALSWWSLLPLNVGEMISRDAAAYFRGGTPAPAAAVE